MRHEYDRNRDIEGGRGYGRDFDEGRSREQREGRGYGSRGRMSPDDDMSFGRESGPSDGGRWSRGDIDERYFDRYGGGRPGAGRWEGRERDFGRRSFDERERFDEAGGRDRYGRMGGMNQARDLYGYNYGDYRDFEGRDQEAGDYGGRGSRWRGEDYRSYGYGGDRGGYGGRSYGYEGSDIRGGGYGNRGGGSEGFGQRGGGYGGGRGNPGGYESRGWGSRWDSGPMGEWSSQGSQESGERGFGGRGYEGERSRGGSWGSNQGRYSNIFDDEESRRRRSVEGYGVGEYSGREQRGNSQSRSFRGTGPKGYSRSDDSIHEDVCDRLEDADIDPSDVTVSVQNGEVTLSGTIDGRWAKRYAEDLAYSVRGVNDVSNQLRVESSESESESESEGQRAKGQSNGRSSRAKSTLQSSEQQTSSMS